MEGSHLLVATGRPPNTEALNLATAGIATDDHGFIKVNSKLETNIAGVYALGDINGGPPSRIFPTTTSAFCAPISSTKETLPPMAA